MPIPEMVPVRVPVEVQAAAPAQVVEAPAEVPVVVSTAALHPTPLAPPPVQVPRRLLQPQLLLPQVGVLLIPVSLRSEGPLRRLLVDRRNSPSDLSQKRTTKVQQIERLLVKLSEVLFGSSVIQQFP